MVQEKNISYKKIDSTVVMHCVEQLEKRPLHELIHVQPCRKIGGTKAKNSYIEVGLNIDSAFKPLYEYIIQKTYTGSEDLDMDSHIKNIRPKLVKLLESDFLGHEITLLLLRKLNNLDYDNLCDTLDETEKESQSPYTFEKLAVNVSLQSINKRTRWDEVLDLLTEIELNPNFRNMLQFEFPVPTMHRDLANVTSDDKKTFDAFHKALRKVYTDFKK